jgi:hypothetical protein
MSPGDTLAAGEARDALAFQRAAVLRDSLGALGLAAAAFADMAARYPLSPWAPKAIAASIASGHAAADSLRDVLTERYAGSPYTGIALGLAADQEQYGALEDSLQRALDALASAAATTGQGDQDDLVPRRNIRSPAQRPAPARPQPGPTQRPQPRTPTRVEP